MISAHAPDATRSAPPSTVRRPTPAERRPGARMPALDGLRAIAVGLVVAYHAAPGAVPSGLIGVDVFFVLSGYLITRGTLRERERGRVHLGAFWRRRARRILPALVTMLLVVGTTSLVVGGDAAVRFSQRLLAGLLFVSNWSQISGGEDYFLGSSPPVLQNLWSLAVEEQFYLVWPVAVLVILWAVAPHAGSLQVRAARRAGTVTAVLAFVSLLWGEIAAITQGNSRAYMGTDTHGFGLLAGAALALWLFARSDDAAGRDRTGRGRAATARHLRAGHHHGVPGALGAAPAPPRAVLVTAASAVGITGILVIALQVPEVSAFTVASPLAVALSMLAILLARGRSPVASLLSTRPMVAVGARSYALYLWHWPPLVILRESAPGSWPAWCAPVLAICLSLLAACFSWTHVEAPILRLGFRGWWAEAQSLGPRPRRLGVVVVAAAPGAGDRRRGDRLPAGDSCPARDRGRFRRPAGRVGGTGRCGGGSRGSAGRRARGPGRRAGRAVDLRGRCPRRPRGRRIGRRVDRGLERRRDRRPGRRRGRPDAARGGHARRRRLGHAGLGARTDGRVPRHHHRRRGLADAPAGPGHPAAARRAGPVAPRRGGGDGHQRRVRPRHAPGDPRRDRARPDADPGQRLRRQVVGARGQRRDRRLRAAGPPHRGRRLAPSDRRRPRGARPRSDPPRSHRGRALRALDRRGRRAREWRGSLTARTARRPVGGGSGDLGRCRGRSTARPSPRRDGARPPAYDGAMTHTEPSAPAHHAPAWVRDAICWQVYPLGFCGAPRHREDLTGEGYGGADGENVVHRLRRLTGWLDHLVSLGANVPLLNPIFDSVSHGYDTLDHRRLDPRLGDDEDFDALVAACRERGLRVVLDGVFNHVSHLHPTARRAIAAGPGTEEGGRIRWSGTSPYGFEGNDDLIEVDLSDPVIQDRVVEIMGRWLERGADGWRLDAMYAAGAEAWAPILERVRAAHPEAWILGEVIHGDYPAVAAASGADSITQYELWKAIWSSLRERNLFELAHALGRHEDFLARFRAAGSGGLPLTFVGNHDTTRIASQLEDGRDLAVATAPLALAARHPRDLRRGRVRGGGREGGACGRGRRDPPLVPVLARGDPRRARGRRRGRRGTPLPAAARPRGGRADPRGAPPVALAAAARTVAGDRVGRRGRGDAVEHLGADRADPVGRRARGRGRRRDRSSGRRRRRRAPRPAHPRPEPRRRGRPGPGRGPRGGQRRGHARRRRPCRRGDGARARPRGGALRVGEIVPAAAEPHVVGSPP
ncbi:alpha-amylase family glycosyl hydrolase [Brachybacterium sp. GPGPB12]|uniref:acyltransferase family protein n=1 Tax=Brachybacterium sp. GPGPB12 TaxID=3023517 RepID=UPI00313431BC